MRPELEQLVDELRRALEAAELEGTWRSFWAQLGRGSPPRHLVRLEAEARAAVDAAAVQHSKVTARYFELLLGRRWQRELAPLPLELH